MKFRVLVTGSSGQLARAIYKTWNEFELQMPEESSLDLGNPDAIRLAMENYRPHVVINAGAFTQVDRCETELDLAMRINGESVLWLAEYCNKMKALLVQLSTDYVFDGLSKRPYKENDPTNPKSIYGKSKLLGETNAKTATEHLIVRTAWLYDAWGRNFYLNMLNAAKEGRKIRVVNDQFGSPTTCRALAHQLKVAINEGWRGLVNVSCSGKCSWYEFAKEIFSKNGVNANISPCTTAEYPTPAVRPAYSVLDGSYRKSIGSDQMSDWLEALIEVVNWSTAHVDS